MKAFYKNNNGLIETQEWTPNCWINIESPTETEKKYLLEELQIPEAFYNDIEDIDERPRVEIEDGWTLIIMRVPIKSNDVKLPFQTIPMGVIFKKDICVTISFYETQIISDFVQYTKRKKHPYKRQLRFSFKVVIVIKCLVFKISETNQSKDKTSRR
ncbi:CorA family divalent cation transporter [Flavobacterium sp. 81]|uniref:CorA family divalent cation transporter n=1 Tax=Flavobacterium sp. 81 TaxID=2135621 RepID=UPI002101D34D|nr:CorA family divalent cation transporter [Flavobacterium sp. 81]